PGNVIAADAPYTMASGSITVTPNTALSSSQVVQIDGSGLQPTYAGPNLLLPTGGWGLAQCDASVGDHPAPWVVFQRCRATPAGGNRRHHGPIRHLARGLPLAALVHRHTRRSDLVRHRRQLRGRPDPLGAGRHRHDPPRAHQLRLNVSPAGGSR